MTDQPTLGLVTGLAANPPNAFPISYASTAATPFVTLGNAFNAAGGSVAPVSVAHNYKDAYFSEWNWNVEQAFGHDYGLMVGYFGTKGSDLNIERNCNQPIGGVRPFAALSASSPIDPGVATVEHPGLRERRQLLVQRALAELKKHLSNGLR